MGTALVTGATSGLGEEFCWQLAAARHDLVIVARTKDRLEQLATRLRQIAGVHVEVLPADLSDPTDVARVAQRLSEPGPRHADPSEGTAAESGVSAIHAGSDSAPAPIGLLVNNAGYGLGRPFLEDDLASEQRALDVMVGAVMVLSHAAARAMVSRGRGAVLNVGSVAADTGMGTYSAHKAWVRTFTEGLHEELRGTGVTATLVSPGLTRTHFHEAAGLDVSATPGWVWSTPEQVVSAALDAVRHGRALVTPTPLYKVTSAVTRLAPRSAVRAIVRRIPHT
ncbi:MAG: SDR family NAD(P)-dependent oxidoreductase [Pauljensenia sp.]